MLSLEVSMESARVTEVPEVLVLRIDTGVEGYPSFSFGVEDTKSRICSAVISVETKSRICSTVTLLPVSPRWDIRMLLLVLMLLPLCIELDFLGLCGVSDLELTPASNDGLGTSSSMV